MAHHDASLRRTDRVAIGGIADMPGASRTCGCDATDPLRHRRARNPAAQQSLVCYFFCSEAREVLSSETARVIRRILSPVESALFALKVSGTGHPRHFGFILRSRLTR